MVLQGRINYLDDGLTLSTRAMVTQTRLMQTHTDNIAHYGIPGYQRKEPVVTSFVEFLGANAVDEATSSEVGRLRRSDAPLDFALSAPGFFQKRSSVGTVEYTRDGRFRIDKEGYLTSLDNKKILSSAGLPIRLPFVPSKLEEAFKVNEKGEIRLKDTEGNQCFVGRLGIANPNGKTVKDISVLQYHVEDSNVYLEREFVSLMPIRRNFEANRQTFLIQSDELSRMIQEIGRTQ